MSSNKREDACLASEMELRMYTRCLAWDLAGNDYGHRAVSKDKLNWLYYFCWLFLKDAFF